MRKLLCMLVVALLCYTQGNSQTGLRLGVNAGLPVGDASDLTSFQLGADVAYVIDAIPMLEVGPMVGYSHFFGKDIGSGANRIEVDDLQFVPLAASGKVNLAALSLGLDLGYAISLQDEVNSGFYYRPKVGFNLFMIGFIASYQGISVDGGNISSVNLGVEFGM